MPKIIKSKMSVKDDKEFEMLKIESERNQAKTDYIAMMTDVDIPYEEDELNEQEV